MLSVLMPAPIRGQSVSLKPDTLTWQADGSTRVIVTLRDRYGSERALDTRQRQQRRIAIQADQRQLQADVQRAQAGKTVVARQYTTLAGLAMTVDRVGLAELLAHPLKPTCSLNPHS